MRQGRGTMAAEDLNGEVGSTQAECTDCGANASSESSFDELARGLATGTISRRKALRLMSGLLVGGALGSIPGIALADDRCSEGQTRCGDRCVNLKRNE